jgi:HlyD family secretion protein
VGTAAIGRPGGFPGSLLVGLISFLLGGLAVYMGIQRFSVSPSVGNGETASAPVVPTSINALGRLEPSGGVISIFGPLGDRVDKLEVAQGAPVKQDQVLAVLASRTDRQQEARLAEIQLEEAKRQDAAIRSAAESKLVEIDLEIKQLQQGEIDDTRVQEAKIKVLDASVRQLQKELKRLESLKGNTRVSEQELDKQRLALENAEGELASAQAVLEKTRNTYRLNLELARAKRKSAEIERDQALQRLPIASLEQNVKLAERHVELTEIKAPVEGTVLAILSHKGEATGNQPILQLAGSNGMTVMAEVYETDVATLYQWLEQYGAVEATITSRAIPASLPEGELKGRLMRRDQIARKIAANRLYSLNPREDTDRRVIQVRVDLDEQSAARARDFVSLQVDVRFQRPK